MTSPRPRILFIAPLCYPPAGSEAIVTSKLVLAMLKAGFDVAVIAQGDFGLHYPTREDPVWDPVRRAVHLIDGAKAGGWLDRLLSTSALRRIRPLRSLLWSLKAFLAARRLLRAGRFDLLVSRAAPQYGHLPALLLSFFHRVRWAACWSDPMPPRKAPPPYGEGAQAAISWGAAAYLGAVARRADWHVFPCERLRDFYARYLESMRGKSVVIPHIALAGTDPPPPPADRETFSVSCFGSLAHRDPSVFFSGLRMFLDRGGAAGHVRVGFTGPPLADFDAKVRAAGVAEVVSASPEVTYEESMEQAAGSSILLLIEACCEEGIFFPSKFVDYVQTGRPILAVSPRRGTIADVLAADGGGIAADCTSPESVADALARLDDAWRRGELDREFGSGRLLARFGEASVVGAYRALADGTEGP